MPRYIDKEMRTALERRKYHLGGGWPNEGDYTVLHGDWHMACRVRWMRGVHGTWRENLESGRVGPQKGSKGK